MMVVTPLLVAGGLMSQAASSTVAGVVTSLVTAGLVLCTLLAVARRLIAHEAVSGATILGAVCVYLLLGLLFAPVYAAFGHLGLAFAQRPHPDTVDVLYFSFVTLTTVGFGDLTPRGDLVRMLAVLEALLGQLYLVTVISVLIGNIGSARRSTPNG